MYFIIKVCRFTESPQCTAKPPTAFHTFRTIWCADTRGATAVFWTTVLLNLVRKGCHIHTHTHARMSGVAGVTHTHHKTAPRKPESQRTYMHVNSHTPRCCSGTEMER